MGARLSRVPPVAIVAVVAALLSALRAANKRRGGSSLTVSASGRGKVSCSSTAIPPRPSRAPPGGPAMPTQPARILHKGAPLESPAERMELEAEIWICLDFEWTCDEGEERKVHPEEGEIIEFAYAVLDAKNGTVASEGQYYCKNTKTPITDFCTNLTGISDETLKNAGTLKDALDALEHDLKAEGLKGRPTCAVAHGSADLELMLPANCKALGLEIPTALRRYVDLRTTAQHHVAKCGRVGVRASTLKQICDALKVEMIGEEHCGLDDSWMVLRSTQELLKAGAEMRSVNLDLERELFERGMLANAETIAERCLCLDGLPFFAIAIEILPWLARHIGGALPAGSALYVVLGNDGRPSGRGVMDFGSREVAAKAFKALYGGQRLITGSTEYYPFEGPKERLILVRPLRCKELSLLSLALITPSANALPMGPGLATFPANADALESLRNGGKGGGKGKSGGKGDGPKVAPAVGCTGVVKTFCGDKGYGFISYGEERDVFVHCNDCPDREPLQAGDRIRFDVMEDQRNGKMKAIHVQVIST